MLTAQRGGDNGRRRRRRRRCRFLGANTGTAGLHNREQLSPKKTLVQQQHASSMHFYDIYVNTFMKAPGGGQELARILADAGWLNTACVCRFVSKIPKSRRVRKMETAITTGGLRSFSSNILIDHLLKYQVFTD